MDVGGGGATAAAYEARPRLGELEAVLGEVAHVPIVADCAVYELGKTGIREGGHGPRTGGHLLYDLDHPLRADRAVRAGEVGAPGGDLARGPLRQALRERLA